MGLLQACICLGLLLPIFTQALPLCGGETSFTVASTDDAAALATALRCSNGDFAVAWVGEVVIEETIYVTNGTSLSVTGTEGALADGDFKTRLFTVDGGASLHLRDMTLIQGSARDGGAIYANASRISFSGVSRFTRNTAHDMYDSSGSWYTTSFSSPYASISGRGGAIHAVSSTLSWDGGDVAFVDNEADYDGGAIWAWRSVVSFNSSKTCEFIGNTGDTDFIYGGAIFASASSLSWNEIGRTIFSNNSADVGGAIYVYASNVTWEAGETQRFDDNFAQSNGGAIWAGHDDSTWWDADDDTTTTTSASSYSIPTWANDDDTTLWTLRSTSSSSTYDDDAINTTSSWANDDTTLSSTSSPTYYFPGEESGSSIAWDGHMVFSNNEAMRNGGGIYLDGSELEVLAGGSAVLSQNKAGRSGGGVFGIAAEFVVSGQASFTNNTADAGAAIGLFGDSSLDFAGENITISGNFASSKGGGIHAEASTHFVVERTTFLANSAGTTGGAISLLSVGVLSAENEPGTEREEEISDAATVSGCRFTGNDARDAGGAVVVAGGVAEISNSEFNGNTAGRSHPLVGQEALYCGA